MQRANNLEGELAVAGTQLSTTKTELSSVSDQLLALQELGSDHQRLVANLEQVTKQFHARRAGLIGLNAEIAHAKARLENLRSKAKEYEGLMAEAPEKYLTTTGAKVRAGLSTTTKELAVVRAGVSLSVVEKPTGETWYKVSLTGFMHRDLLRPVP